MTFNGLQMVIVFVLQSSCYFYIIVNSIDIFKTVVLRVADRNSLVVVSSFFQMFLVFEGYPLKLKTGPFHLPKEQGTFEPKASDF